VNLPTIPSEVRVQGANYTDAIETSLNMMYFVYGRLKGILRDLATALEERAEGSSFPIARSISALIDGWSMVDIASRSSDLLRGWPGVKRRSWPQIEAFLRSTNRVGNLRNAIQHLTGELHEFDRPEYTAWGSLEWLARSTTDRDKYRTYKLLGGSLRGGGEYGLLTTIPENPSDEVNHVVLRFRENRLNLTALAQLTHELQIALQPLFQDLHRAHPATSRPVIFHADVRIDPSAPPLHRDP